MTTLPSQSLPGQPPRKSLPVINIKQSEGSTAASVIHWIPPWAVKVDHVATACGLSVTWDHVATYLWTNQHPAATLRAGDTTCAACQAFVPALRQPAARAPRYWGVA